MWTTKEAKLKNDIEAWKLECSLMHLKNLTSDTFAKVSLSKSRFVIGRYALNSARIHLISTISLLFLFRVNGIYTFLAIQWNSLRTPELTELHPLVNKLLRHKRYTFGKKTKTKIHPYLVAEVPFGFFTLVRQFTGESNLIQWALLDCFVHRFLYPFELFLKIFE